ncbi:MAG: VCBS repeat-containing protein [Ignavibacteriales bacterium]|nr:VCBS repeat-containing protein [Ignavibacteriales bacterium]
MDGNGKPEFWIGGEDFGYDFTKLICYESNGNNSYNPVAEIEFPYLLSLNPAEATSIDVDNDGKEEIFLRIGNVVVFIKLVW